MVFFSFNHANREIVEWDCGPPPLPKAVMRWSGWDSGKLFAKCQPGPAHVIMVPTCKAKSKTILLVFNYDKMMSLQSACVTRSTRISWCL